MYPGFVGTVLSHFLSLIATLWAICVIPSCRIQSLEYYFIRFGFLLIGANSSLALVRYGRTDGYKLRALHIVTLSISSILSFTITETAFLYMNKSSPIYLFFPASNVIPLLSNILKKDYRCKLKVSDVFIAINCLFFLVYSFLNENYNGVALSMSYFFGYFIVGDSGYFLDTEVPSVDAFQYLTCFFNFFTVGTFCN